MAESISVLGCGWLGLPLGKVLVGRGYEVYGSTTQNKKLKILQQVGIKPYLINFSPEINPEVDRLFFQSNVLVVNIPPGRHQENVETYYAQQISEIVKQSPSQKIIFISSTSVYPNLNREVIEVNIPASDSERKSLRASGRALIAAEQVVQQYSTQTTIVRFCGLMGPDRHPGRFLAGKQLSSSGQAPINFIHLDDCIAIILQIIQEGIWGKVFNACADEHPTKEEFYSKATQKAGLESPEFTSDGKASFKQINSQKLKDQLGYQFIYANPSDAL